MRRAALLGGALWALTSGTALALPLAVAPAPDYAGRGSGAALSRAVAAALSREGQPLVEGTAAARGLPAAARSAGRAAAVATAKGWAGVLLLGPVRRRRIEAELVSADGDRIPLRPLDIAKRRVSPKQLTALARAVISALARRAATPPSETAPAPEPPPTSVAPEETLAPPPSTSAKEPSSPEATSTEAVRWRLAAGPFAGSRKFSLPSVFSYQTAFPYAGPALSGELFPLGELGPWLAGLGLVAGGSLGVVRAQFSGGSQPFTATDLRADVDLAYRLSPFGGALTPALELYGGWGLRNFDASASSGLVNDDRSFGELGLDVTQPLVPARLSLDAGASYLPGANQSAAAQAAYGASVGSGFGWRAGLSGAISGAFGWAARVDQERFTDSHLGGASAIEIFTAYELLLTIRPAADAP